jgi:hypothetical protein
MDHERSKREEALRREAAERPATDPRVDAVGYGADDPLAEPMVRRAGTMHGGVGAEEEARLEEGVRRGARRAIDEKEQETSGGGGLYGSQIDASHIVGAAIAELVGTFVLVFGGTAVAVGAILARPTAGAAYDSLAVALAFGLALVAVVAAVGHVSGAHVNPAVTLGMAATKKFPWMYVPHYIGAQLVGAVLAALATWVTFGGAGCHLSCTGCWRLAGLHRRDLDHLHPGVRGYGCSNGREGPCCDSSHSCRVRACGRSVHRGARDRRVCQPGSLFGADAGCGRPQ